MVNSYIALGYRCNHNCINCPLSTYDRLHGELNQEVIEKHVKELSKYGKELYITISGGEPTLNSNFLKVLNILGKSDANITVLSNATKCRDKEFVNSIIMSLGKDYDFKRFKYVTAIHSCDEKIHDKLTGTQGSYIETIQGLENLDEKNIHIVVKIIMNKISAPTMSKTVEYLSKHFSNNVDFELCATDYSGRCSKNLNELYINFKELQPFVEECLDLYEKNKNNCGRNIQIIETPLCLTDPYYWKYYKIINNKGVVYIAPNNEKKENISENMQGNCNTEYEECKECDVKKYCSGVWKSTYNIEKNKENIIRAVKEIKI